MFFLRTIQCGHAEKRTAQAANICIIGQFAARGGSDLIRINARFGASRRTGFNLGVIAHFRYPGRRQHTEHRANGRGLYKTAFQGASEYSFKFAKIGDLGANFAEMGRRQGLNLGARGPARFGKTRSSLISPIEKPISRARRIKDSRSTCSGP